MKGSILLIVVCSLFLTACSASRRTVQARSETERSAAVHLTGQAARLLRDTALERSTASVVVTTTIEEYDTARPRDSLTGTPPLRRRQVTTSRTRMHRTAAAATVVTDTLRVRSEAHAAAETATRQETSEAREPALARGWGWFRAGIIVALAALLAAWALRNRIKNRLKAP